MSTKLLSVLESKRNEMANALMELVRIPAIAPQSGGEGELKKAEKLTRMLENMGFDKIHRYDSPDTRVPSGIRPNIVAYSDGEITKERLWIITHVDVVPAGEESLWTVTKPFEPKVENDRIYGRGAEDNGQSLMASVFAVKVLKELNIRPKRTIALCFVADEEQGNVHGIQHLLKQSLFRKDDLIVVPDSGEGDGSFIEISEKSALWFKVRTTGIQTHASRPNKGLNAHRIGMQYAVALDKLLHDKYSSTDKYFDPSGSTFEPTMKVKNVDAINIAPGEDIAYFDCRILPKYDVDEILATVRELAGQYEKATGARIGIEVVHESKAPEPTDPKAKIVLLLEEVLKKIRHVKPRIGGIGGGTCAAYFREINIPAVVWSTVDETAHQPNEYAKISNLVDDAKTFATLAIS